MTVTDSPSESAHSEGNAEPVTDPEDPYMDIPAGAPFGPEDMPRYIHDRRLWKLAASTLVDVYVASSMRYPYPYKIAGVTEGRQSIRQTADPGRFILDSDINKEDCTNEDVIERAESLDPYPEYVVPKDYLGEPEETTASIDEFYELWNSSPLADSDTQVMLPVQPPHDEHVNDLLKFPTDAYVVGGVANSTPGVQLGALVDTREVVGRDAYLHGLGFGSNIDFITQVRELPGLVDSVDTSTPERLPINNNAVDRNLSKMQFEYPKGRWSSIVRGEFARAHVTLLTLMLSPFYEGLDDKNPESILMDTADQTDSESIRKVLQEQAGD